MKILVVDDSRTMRMIVKRTLRQAGFGGHSVEEAENGVDAIQKIKANLPDLILCDWNMPKMTGIELLTRLNRAGLKIRFGFVTSESTPEMRARAHAAGALFLIAKPFNPSTFEEALRPVLG